MFSAEIVSSWAVTPTGIEAQVAAIRKDLTFMNRGLFILYPSISPFDLSGDG